MTYAWLTIGIFWVSIAALFTWPLREPSNLIPWNQIALIDSQHPEPGETPEISQTVEASGESLPENPLPTRPMRTQSGQLAELRPADIADIIHQLTPGQGARILEGLD